VLRLPRQFLQPLFQQLQQPAVHHVEAHGIDIEHAQAELTDVVTYSEMARDYSLQSHKYQKQTEIAVRVMTRKLTEVMHVLTHDDQAPVREAITRMQRVRDDLLASMFKKGSK